MELNNNEPNEPSEPNEDKNIAYKNNVIDSNNNNIDAVDLIKLCKTIDSLENSHHIEIGKILKINNVYLNENSNGIFVNLNKIPPTVYNKDEKLKRTLQTTYFKDNKDIVTTNTSN